MNAKFPGGSFSASVDYHRVSESSNSQKTVYTEATAVCMTYYADVQNYVQLNLSESFVNAIVWAEVEPDDYYAILNAFGTHYTSGLGMGSKCVLQSEFTEDKW